MQRAATAHSGADRDPRSPTFGALVRQYRQQSALSQASLAERAGLSVDAVSVIERGKRGTPVPRPLHCWRMPLVSPVPNGPLSSLLRELSARHSHPARLPRANQTTTRRCPRLSAP